MRRRRRARERQGKRATDFKEAVCCPSAVVQGEHGKKWFVRGECPG